MDRLIVVTALMLAFVSSANAIITPYSDTACVASTPTNGKMEAPPDYERTIALRSMTEQGDFTQYLSYLEKLIRFRLWEIDQHPVDWQKIGETIVKRARLKGLKLTQDQMDASYKAAEQVIFGNRRSVIASAWDDVHRLYGDLANVLVVMQEPDRAEDCLAKMRDMTGY